MSDSTSTHGLSTNAAPATSLPRWVWLAGGGALLVISGLASALVFKGKPVDVETTRLAAATAPQGEATSPALKPAPKPVAKAPVPETCKDCGVVESVKAVQKKGAATGVGVVAGGVLGGVVGHQMGGGNGKTAMTVLGAIGGGVAGNEVEKRARAETVYQVQLRMDDGTKRTLTLNHAPVARGDRVAVEGQNLRRLQADEAG